VRRVALSLSRASYALEREDVYRTTLDPCQILDFSLGLVERTQQRSIGVHKGYTVR